MSQLSEDAGDRFTLKSNIVTTMNPITVWIEKREVSILMVLIAYLIQSQQSILCVDVGVVKRITVY